MRTGPNTIMIMLGATLLGVAQAGCGSTIPAPETSPSADLPPATSPRAALAARAAAAQDLVAVSLYTLERTDPDQDGGTVMVVRAEDGGWRVDVPGGALGGAADVAIARIDDATYQCVQPPAEPGCVRVPVLTEEIDPRVHRVFTDWLEVLIDRAAPLSVSMAEPLSGVGGDCFSVEASTASLEPPLATGVYCFEVDGTLTGARLDFGTLTLVSTDSAAPTEVDLPAPVVNTDPLPTESPRPSPTPTPSPTTTPTPAV